MVESKSIYAPVLCEREDCDTVLIIISKPKYRVLLLLILSLGFYSIPSILGTPAPTLPSIIAPGSMNEQCNYLIYIDSPNNYMARNCKTGDNDCGPSNDAGVVTQCAINNLPLVAMASSGSFGTIKYGFGMFNFSTPATQTNPGSIHISGQGRQSTQLYLAAGTDIFDFLPNAATDLYEMKDFKAMGDGVVAGTSYCFNFGANTREINFVNVEIRDCHTAGIYAQSTNDAGFNTLINTWLVNDQRGLWASVGDWIITGSRFFNNLDSGIYADMPGGRLGRFTITGSEFITNAAAITWTSNDGQTVISGNSFQGDHTTLTKANNVTLSGSFVDMLIADNVFSDCSLTLSNAVNSVQIQANQFYEFGAMTMLKLSDRGGATQDNVLINDNIFRSAINGGLGVYVGNNVDNVTIAGNYFAAKTGIAISYGTGTKNSLTVQGNLGYNPIGKTANFVIGSTFGPWGTSSTVVASTDYVVQGTNVLVTSTGGTGVSITVKDNLGNTVTGLSALATLTAQYIPQGYKVNFGAFSGAPTITVFWQ